jgi:hypothetical protein
VISVVEGEFRVDVAQPVVDLPRMREVLEMIVLLVLNGANIHVENSETKKNLLYTIVEASNFFSNIPGCIDCFYHPIEFLLKRDILIVSSTGLNPLSITNDIKITKMILNFISKSDLNEGDSSGKTPYAYQMLSKRSNSLVIMQLLQQRKPQFMFNLSEQSLEYIFHFLKLFF